MKEQGPQQIEMQLWPEDQRNQLRRDFDALKERLKRIPSERENEALAIENRYKNIVDRTFPAAVVFLVPESELGRNETE